MIYKCEKNIIIDHTGIKRYEEQSRKTGDCCNNFSAYFLLWHTNGVGDYWTGCTRCSTFSFAARTDLIKVALSARP